LGLLFFPSFSLPQKLQKLQLCIFILNLTKHTFKQIWETEIAKDNTLALHEKLYKLPLAKQNIRQYCILDYV